MVEIYNYNLEIKKRAEILKAEVTIPEAIDFLVVRYPRLLLLSNISAMEIAVSFNLAGFVLALNLRKMIWMFNRSIHFQTILPISFDSILLEIYQEYLYGNLITREQYVELFWYLSND